MIYTDVMYTGKIRFAIRTQGEIYLMSATNGVVNNGKGIDWQGTGFEEFKADFEDLVNTLF